MKHTGTHLFQRYFMEKCSDFLIYFHFPPQKNVATDYAYTNVLLFILLFYYVSSFLQR